MKSMRPPVIRPEPHENPNRWHVEYAVELDNGTMAYPVTTVFRTQVPSGNEQEILAIADAAVLPGIILQDRQLAPSVPEVPPPVDYFAIMEIPKVERRAVQHQDLGHLHKDEGDV